MIGGLAEIGLEFLGENRVTIRTFLATTVAPWVLFLPGFLGHIRGWPAAKSWRLLMVLGGIGWIVGLAAFTYLLVVAIQTGQSTYRMLQGMFLDLFTWVRLALSLEPGQAESLVTWAFLTLAAVFIIGFVILTVSSTMRSSRERHRDGRASE